MSILLIGIQKILFPFKWLLGIAKKNEVLENKMYYDQLWLSIEEMPIWSWNRIIETGDLTYLFKDRTEETRSSNRLNSVWLDLQQQHMNEFGVDGLVVQRMRYIKNIIQLNIKFVNTRDRSLLNLIKVEEAKLKASESTFKYRFYKVLDAVTTSKKFRVDPKEFTVIEWYHALKNMSNGNDKR